MVKKGNPKGIKTLADLSGKTVSVEVGHDEQGSSSTRRAQR